FCSSVLSMLRVAFSFSLHVAFPSLSSTGECPSCGSVYPPTERFCLSCGIPLVPVEEPPAPDPARERARKVDPAYTQGPLVQVARSEEHTSELQSREKLVCRLLLEKK